MNPAGKALPGETISSFGLPFLCISMGTFARPFAAFIAATTQALTLGEACSRHLARLASWSPPPPVACMQAITIGLPTVSRQLARACSFDNAMAFPQTAIRATPAIKPAASRFAKEPERSGTTTVFPNELGIECPRNISTPNGPGSIGREIPGPRTEPRARLEKNHPPLPGGLKRQISRSPAAIRAISPHKTIEISAIRLGG
jgi:hypothetical protein